VVRRVRLSPTSPKRDWYVWRADDPGWKQPWGDQKWPTWHEANGAYYYGIFWSGMPDLNLANPAVRAEVKRIAGLWLGRGVDGFRLDAARHAIATARPAPERHAGEPRVLEGVRGVRTGHRSRGPAGRRELDSTEIIATYYGDTSTVALATSCR